MDNHFDPLESPAAAFEPAPAMAPGLVSILLVDDHEPNLTALEVILDSPRFHLVKASSGAEALECVRLFDFGAILLDVQMPGMDGFETARRIRAMENGHNTPIVFVTAIDRDTAYAERGYEVGAVDYIVKPINPNILRPKIDFFAESHLSRKRLAALEGDSRFRLMADTAPVLIVMSDINRKPVWFNRAWLKFTGRGLAQELKAGWENTIHPEDWPRCREQFRAAFAGRQEFKIDYRLRHHSGGYRWVLDHGVPHFDADGRFRGYMGSCMDIDDQKQAIRTRDEFLSIASHELKTPVTSLKLQLQMLERHLKKSGSLPLKAEYLKNLAQVGNRQINQLIMLIDDMLDVSRISTGQLNFEMQDLDLSLLAAETVASFQAQFRNAGVQLSTQLEANIHVRGDQHRLEQVISNLLTNALKYGARQPVELRVVRSGGQVQLAVTDHGMGISAENLERIFERFERAVSPSTVSGLGLGLYISREIMAAHGGAILVESSEGRGSKFELNLPLLNSAAGISGNPAK